MFSSCLKKQNAIKKMFSLCHSKEKTYEKIIELGKKASPLDAKHQIPANRVPGCQSIVYLRAHLAEEAMIFEAASESLISSGLASLLIHVYSGEAPETILTCPPSYLEELGISTALTPNRTNGLYSMHLRMKQEALSFLHCQQR